MNWQSSHPRSEQDIFSHYPTLKKFEGQQPEMQMMDQQHFLSCSTTREHEELARRKAEHLEAIEHIAPQQGYISATYRSSRLTEKALREHFHLPLLEVAKKFGMCTTAFKKLCRKQGVMHWPQRTLKSLEKKIASLHAEQKFTSDQNHIEEQIRKLQAKREQILAGNGVVNLEHEAELHGASPSDDSTNSASGSSSPRATDVLSHLALDDTSSTASGTSFHDDKHDRRRHSADDIRLKESRDAVDRTLHSRQLQDRDSQPDREVAEHRSLMNLEAGGKGMRRAKTYGGLSSVQYYEGEGFTHSSPHAEHFASLQTPSSLRSGDAFGRFLRKDAGEHPEGGFFAGGAYFGGDPYGDEGGFAASHVHEAAASHLQSILGENKSLRSVIRSLAQERDEWMRRSMQVESELEGYRAHCHQLELLLQNGIQAPPAGSGRHGASEFRNDVAFAGTDGSGRGGGGEDCDSKGGGDGRDYRQYALDLDPQGHHDLI